MSLALKQSKGSVGAASGGAFMSRTQFQGDPGLFGFLGKAAGGILRTAGSIVPGPVGAAAAGLGGLLAGRRSGAAEALAQAQNRSIARVPPQQVPTRRAPINLPGPIGGPGAGFPMPFARGGRVSIGENGGQMMGTQLACPSGFHPNKTSYFLKDGTFVEKGTRCVKNRRKNPLNPRAASRAISRLESAKKATRRLDRINIKCRRCGKVRCSC